MRCPQLRINGLQDSTRRAKRCAEHTPAPAERIRRFRPPGCGIKSDHSFPAHVSSTLAVDATNPIPDVLMRGKSDESSPIVGVQQIEFKLFTVHFRTLCAAAAAMWRSIPRNIISWTGHSKYQYSEPAEPARFELRDLP